MDGPDTANNHLLTVYARWFLGIVGLLATAVGVFLLWQPPIRNAFPPQCANAECVAPVHADMAVPATALITGGLLLLVLGVNGRVLLSFKFGGAEAGLADAQKDADVKAVLGKVVEEPDIAAMDAAEDQGPPLQEGRARVVRIGEAELLRVNPGQIPGRVLAALPPPLSTASDISWAARRTGRGNHPWYVKSKSERVFRISFGGQGKTEPTVTELD